MEQEKNKNGVNLLLIFIIVILAVLCVLLATGTIKLKTNEVSNITGNNNQIADNNVTFDLDKLNKYKNYDGSYGKTKVFSLTDDTNKVYAVSLSLNGKVRVCYDTTCNYISNVDNVVDLIQMSVPAQVEYFKYYILQSNGDLYEYELTGVKKSNFKAKKNTTASNVVKITNISYNDIKNAGGCNAILAITKDAQYIEINAECV